jgi:3-methyladenine DNA glycosylase/8-oxoguanine DNA glycosylase
MNPKSAAALAKLDPAFDLLIQRIGPIQFKTKTTKSPYEALVEAVVYQQLTAKAAGTIFERLKSLYPNRSFPTPADLLACPVEQLRGAGLSRSKAASIHDIAQKSLDGTIPSMRAVAKMTEEEIVDSLTSIRGVGRWTVEMFLIFRLGRPDVFPVMDYGIQKGFMKVFRKRKLPTPELLNRYGRRWQPHRTTAALYLWRALDSKYT